MIYKRYLVLSTVNMVLVTTDGFDIDGKITKNLAVREINVIFNIKIFMIED